MEGDRESLADRGWDPGAGRLNSVSTQTANADIGTRERPKRQGGACRVRPLFTGQNPQPCRRCEEGRHRAPHGECVSNRVWANAAGRRGLFLKGRSLSRFEQRRPLRKRTERGRRKATPKAGDGKQGPGQHQMRRFQTLQRFLPAEALPQFANAAPTYRQNPIDRRIQVELPTAILGWPNLTDFSQIDSPAAVDLEESVILEMWQKHRELTYVGQTINIASSDEGIALFGLKEKDLIGYHRPVLSGLMILLTLIVPSP